MLQIGKKKNKNLKETTRKITSRLQAASRYNVSLKICQTIFYLLNEWYLLHAVHIFFTATLYYSLRNEEHFLYFFVISSKIRDKRSRSILIILSEKSEIPK